MKVVIVGGVAGGATAATRLRRLSEKHQIVIFERGKHVSFANCGLPYHIGGIIEKRDRLLLQTPDSLYKRFALDVRMEMEVLLINTKNKTIQVKDLVSGEVYDESYDKLLLSPGANPIRPDIEGVDSEKVMTLRSIQDMDRIIQAVKTAKHIAVIGGGFIGLEVAENLIHKNIGVTLFQNSLQVMNQVDFEMASLLHKELRGNGVELKLGAKVEGFQEVDNHIEVTYSSGQKMNFDAVVMAIGVRPESNLAQKAGLKLGKTGGILVDKYLQTSDPDIYAVGDAIEVKQYVSGAKVLIPLAWPANRQGRIVADNIHYGNQRTYKGSLGASILKVFDVTLGSVGLNEASAKVQGLHYEVATVTRSSHAGYYPGANPIVLKLIFGKDGTIYGAQAVGREGVDKRIDTVATAMKAGMKVQDLADIEVAYAPPFNSAKDPVNIAGYVAENLLNEALEQIQYHDVLDYKTKEDVVFLDVRTQQEHNSGHIPGSENIEVDTLRSCLKHLDKTKTYLVYCKVGLRGYIAYRILKNNGFRALNLNGGYDIWVSVNA